MSAKGTGKGRGEDSRREGEGDERSKRQHKQDDHVEDDPQENPQHDTKKNQPCGLQDTAAEGAVASAQNHSQDAKDERLPRQETDVSNTRSPQTSKGESKTSARSGSAESPNRSPSSPRKRKKQSAKGSPPENAEGSSQPSPQNTEDLSPQEADLRSEQHPSRAPSSRQRKGVGTRQLTRSKSEETLAFTQIMFLPTPPLLPPTHKPYSLDYPEHHRSDSQRSDTRRSDIHRRENEIPRAWEEHSEPRDQTAPLHGSQAEVSRREMLDNITQDLNYRRIRGPYLWSVPRDQVSYMKKIVVNMPSRPGSGERFHKHFSLVPSVSLTKCTPLPKVKLQYPKHAHGGAGHQDEEEEGEHGAVGAVGPQEQVIPRQRMLSWPTTYVLMYDPALVDEDEERELRGDYSVHGEEEHERHRQRGSVTSQPLTDHCLPTSHGAPTQQSSPTGKADSCSEVFLNPVALNPQGKPILHASTQNLPAQPPLPPIPPNPANEPVPHLPTRKPSARLPLPSILCDMLDDPLQPSSAEDSAAKPPLPPSAMKEAGRVQNRRRRRSSSSKQGKQGRNRSKSPPPPPPPPPSSSAGRGAVGM